MVELVGLVDEVEKRKPETAAGSAGGARREARRDLLRLHLFELRLVVAPDVRRGGTLRIRAADLGGDPALAWRKIRGEPGDARRHVLDAAVEVPVGGVVRALRQQ